MIRLVVLISIRFPLSLHNVEDLLFARDIRRERVNRMRHWRWHLDEMQVKGRKPNIQHHDLADQLR